MNADGERVLVEAAVARVARGCGKSRLGDSCNGKSRLGESCNGSRLGESCNGGAGCELTRQEAGNGRRRPASVAQGSRYVELDVAAACALLRTTFVYVISR